MEGQTDIPPPLMEMFINSSDTLQSRSFDQSIPETWNDHPPLFKVPEERHRFYRATQEENPIMLKGMVRQGIPPPLRCAVWLSNIVQTCHPDQDQKISHEYRTLAKVRILDHAYDSLWRGDNAPLAEAKSELVDSKSPDPGAWVSFGNPTSIELANKYPAAGQVSLQRVLYALEFVLGVEYAPMIPALATILLGTMSESYAFTAIREMAHHSTWYWPCTMSEDVAHSRAFLDVLSKLHPQTAKTLELMNVGEQFTKAIFHNLFGPLLPEKYVLRIVDIYTLEGTKALFRFGVAMAVLFVKEWKGENPNPSSPVLSEGEEDQGIVPIPASVKADSEQFFPKLREWSNSDAFDFELVVKKAYGVHGRGVRKRYRFPRRPILARILKLEEDRYFQQRCKDGDDIANMPSARALPVIVSDNGITDDSPFDKDPTKVRLGEPSWLRAQLAEFLPLSLRMTKLDLIYSTDYHGRTLDALYRRCQNAMHTIMLVEPLEPTNNIYAVGMYASQTWKMSTKVYGDGECFLFRLNDNDAEGSQCWKWKPTDSDNMLEEEGQESNNRTALLEQFQVGTRDYISMGGNRDGSAGLRLNEDLTRAETSSAAGFHNDPLVPSGLFEVGLVEVYQLVPLYT